MESVVRKSCLRNVVACGFLLGVVLSAVGLLTSDSVKAARIEAVKGKQYRMSKRHGPWMIMVASFCDIPKTRLDRENGRTIRIKNDRYSPGISAQEAADRLVYQLRKKGIPAYAFSQDDLPARKNAAGRRGRGRRQPTPLLEEEGSVCVLAGNYSHSNDKVAQRTLSYIKTKFQPRLLTDVDKQAREKVDRTLFQKVRSGGILRRTPGRPQPLSGAFLTTNPLLTPEEAARRRRDPLLLKLNSGAKYSLLDNPGRFTVIVATSFIESQSLNGSRQSRKAIKNFQISQPLDETAMKAWQLAATLREGRTPINNGKLGLTRRKFDAYVYHDRRGSVVTVGSFNSPNDPRIAELKKNFGAKVRKNPRTGRDVLIAEVVTLPDPKTKGASLQSWIFDPYPRVMKVPILR